MSSHIHSQFTDSTSTKTKSKEKHKGEKKKRKSSQGEKEKTCKDSEKPKGSTSEVKEKRKSVEETATEASAKHSQKTSAVEASAEINISENTGMRVLFTNCICIFMNDTILLVSVKSKIICNGYEPLIFNLLASPIDVQSKLCLWCS